MKELLHLYQLKPRNLLQIVCHHPFGMLAQEEYSL
jgi:hypothetical protein